MNLIFQSIVEANFQNWDQIGTNIDGLWITEGKEKLVTNITEVKADSNFKCDQDSIHKKKIGVTKLVTGPSLFSKTSRR